VTLTDPARFLFVTAVVTITKTGERRRVDMPDGLRQMLSTMRVQRQYLLTKLSTLPSRQLDLSHVGDSLQGVQIVPESICISTPCEV